MRRIKKAKIKFISLVPRGANALPTLFKEDGAFEVGMLSKGMDEEGLITAIVYAPELRDSQGDIASAEVVKAMAYDAAKTGVEIDLRHDGKALSKDQAYVAESFLVQKGDPRFADLKDYKGNHVDPTGAWGVVIKIDDENLRKLYRDGGWRGVSMAGSAELVQTHKSADPEDFVDRVVDSLNKKLNPQETPMKPEEIEALAKSITTAVVAGIAKSNEVQTPEAPASSEAPVFKGDPTSDEDLQAYEKELLKHQLTQRLAKGDLAEVRKIRAELAKLDEGSKDSPEESDELKLAKEELRKAEEKLRKAEGASRQPAAPENKQTPGGQASYENVNKEEEDLASVGSAMAKWANALRA